MSGIRTRRAVLPDPHDYDPDPAVPERCRCKLPEAHGVHSEAAIEAERRRADGWKGAESRRIGERPE